MENDISLAVCYTEIFLVPDWSWRAVALTTSQAHISFCVSGTYRVRTAGVVWTKMPLGFFGLRALVGENSLLSDKDWEVCFTPLDNSTPARGIFTALKGLAEVSYTLKAIKNIVFTTPSAFKLFSYIVFNKRSIFFLVPETVKSV